jgi:hypothetical protein
VRLNVENARRTVTDLEGRLENRKRELQSMRHVVNGTPIVLGGFAPLEHDGDDNSKPAIPPTGSLTDRKRKKEPTEPAEACSS